MLIDNPLWLCVHDSETGEHLISQSAPNDRSAMVSATRYVKSGFIVYLVKDNIDGEGKEVNVNKLIEQKKKKD